MTTEDAYYFPAINEDGWKGFPDEQLGFRPDLDVDLIERKVHGLLLELHEAKFVYVSNGTMGEVITENVVARCRKEDVYDQHSILRFILEDPNLAEDADYWMRKRKEAETGA